MVMQLPASVSRYLEAQRPMLIGGEWLGSVTSGWKPTVNPADGKVIGEYAVAGEAEVNQAVAAARQAAYGPVMSARRITWWQASGRDYFGLIATVFLIWRFPSVATSNPDGNGKTDGRGWKSTPNLNLS